MSQLPRASALVIAFTLSAHATTAQPRARQIVVSVVDAGGAPVPGLTAADVAIREAGIERPVTRVSPSAATMRIALLVDNGALATPTIKDLRAGLDALVDAIPQDDELLFATIARRFRLRVPPTADRQKVKASIGLLIADNAAGTALLDGVLETDDRFFRKDPDRRPVVVIVTTDGPETSSVRQDVLNPRIDEMIQRGVTVHAIVLSHPGESGTERAMCSNFTQLSGGHMDVIGAITESLPNKLRDLGTLVAEAHRRMNAEYQVEFLSDAKSPQQAEIIVKRPGVRVTVSRAAPARRQDDSRH